MGERMGRESFYKNLCGKRGEEDPFYAIKGDVRESEGKKEMTLLGDERFKVKEKERKKQSVEKNHYTAPTGRMLKLVPGRHSVKS